MTETLRLPMSRATSFATLAVILAISTKPRRGGASVPQCVRDARQLCALAMRMRGCALEARNGIRRYDPKTREVATTWTVDDQTRFDMFWDICTAKITDICKKYYTNALFADSEGNKLAIHIQRDPQSPVVQLAFRAGTWVS